MTGLSRRSAVIVAGALLLRAPNVIGATQEDDLRAPFGLTWGASSAEVRKSGVQLTLNPGKSNFGAEFTATELSKVISDIDTVILFFGYDNKLWRIAAASRTMGPDPFGSQAVARYKDIAASLAERYGHGVETDVRDHEMWKQPNEYIMSLHQGRAFRYTIFQSSTVNVELSVRASSSDQAYYLILFEYLVGARKFEADKKLHEKDAL